MTEDHVARLVVVHGFVQGVFFRDACRQEAERHQVGGWVRNEPDGTVAAHFEGSPEAVQSMVAWCHQGPRRAMVERVDVTGTDPTGTSRFDVVA